MSNKEINEAVIQVYKGLREEYSSRARKMVDKYHTEGNIERAKGVNEALNIFYEIGIGKLNDKLKEMES